MTTCDASFYTHGIKFRSRQTCATIDGRTLAIICGNEKPGDGEIHIDQLPVGSNIEVDDLRTPLIWQGRGQQSRNDRHFDETALRAQFGEQYPKIVAIAAGNLSPNGARESRGYAKTVATAYTKTLPVTGVAHQLGQTRGALIHTEIDELLQRAHDNTGVLAAITDQLLGSLHHDDWEAHRQLARIAEVMYHHGDRESSVLTTNRQLRHLSQRLFEASTLEELTKCQRAIKATLDASELLRGALLGSLSRIADQAVDAVRAGNPKPAMGGLAAQPSSDQQTILRDVDAALEAFNTELAAQHRTVASWINHQEHSVYRNVTGTGYLFVVEWGGMSGDGSVITHISNGTTPMNTRNGESSVRYPSIDTALKGENGTTLSQADNIAANDDAVAHRLRQIAGRTIATLPPR